MNRFSLWLRRLDLNGALGHWLVILFCASGLGLAAFLQLPSADASSVAISDHALPSICGFKNLTGVDCPGCGLTRSWVAGMHGRFSESFAYHRLGWLLMLYAAAQIVRHGLWLALPGRRTPVNLWGRRLDSALLPMSLLVILNWAVGFFLP